MNRGRFANRRDFVAVAGLCVAVVLIWCAAYNRWNAAGWRTPTTYGGDAWWGMAIAKAVAAGDVWPFLPKNPATLGAPFTANWNDYPSVEEGVIGWSGLLVRAFGLLLGTNLALVAAHIFAAVSFYAVCRYLRYDRLISAAAALLFAFSPFIFWRGLPHLGLSYYWHLPLGLLVIWWCVAKGPALRGGKLWFSLAVGGAFGVQNPYYTGMFLQFLFLAALCQIVRRARWEQIAAPLAVGAAAMAMFLAANLDTLATRAMGGESPRAVERAYQHLELYALKPIELLLPRHHRSAALSEWAEERYFRRAMIIGEAGSAYLGFVALLGAGWMLWRTFRALALKDTRPIPSHLWLGLWIAGYSVVGGLNGVVGFGFELFRSTNRYSILLLLIALLFVVRELSRASRHWHLGSRAVLAAAMALIGLADQIPRAPDGASIASARQRVKADADTVRTIERKLPRGARIFQMPVIEFPESDPKNRMGAYEHFRPYLYAKALHFSFGNNKGGRRDNWQREVEQLHPGEMAQLLERYGFSAIWINRKGYADFAASLIENLRAAGYSNVLSDSTEYICIRLTPSLHPTLPPEFSAQWYALESTPEHDQRWSSGDATIVLFNPSDAPKTSTLTFAMRSLSPATIQIHLRDQQLFERRLTENEHSTPVSAAVILLPGRNVLRFRTDRAGELPGNGDPRKLAFNIQNFRILE